MAGFEFNGGLLTPEEIYAMDDVELANLTNPYHQKPEHTPTIRERIAAEFGERIFGQGFLSLEPAPRDGQELLPE